MKYLIFLIILIIVSCNSSDYYSIQYNKQLILNSIPDNKIKDYVKQYEKLSPDSQIIKIYNDINNKWNYIPDKINNDTIRYCSDILSDYTGDCDDFSVLLKSIFNILNINSVFVLGVNNKNSGHIWIEVELCSIKDIEFYNKIKKEFKEFNIIIRNNKYWLQLEKTKLIKNYKVKYII